MNEISTQYYIDNKLTASLRMANYYSNRRQNILLRVKQHYLINKNSMYNYRLDKYNCECGGKYHYPTKQRHFLSKKQQDFINNDLH